VTLARSAHRLRGIANVSDRMDPAAAILFGVLAAYAAAGLVIGLAFVVCGVTQVQPAPATLGARILFLPAAISLWPVVLARWLRSRRVR
jgi:hypothetical protein